MGNAVIQLRNDTASNWTTNNPTLALGEMGIETDTKKMKVGDGSTAWNSLDYYGTGASFKYGLYTVSYVQSSNLSVNDHIEFDTFEGSIGGLSTGSGQQNGIITLPAGKTYKITGAFRFGHSSAGYTAVKIYNRTDSAYVGIRASATPPSLNNTHNSQQPTLLGIITTSVNTDIEVRLSTVSYTSSLFNSDSYLLIEEYGGY